MPASVLVYGISLALSVSVPHAINPLSVQAEQTAYRSVIEPAAGIKLVPFTRTTLPKWHEVISRHEDQVSRDGTSWERLVSQFQHVPAADLLKAVNEEINRARYLPDAANWKTPDYWATPQELLERGGDCEDYALAKYLILRELGVSPSHMEIAVTRSHAVLIVVTQDGPVVLDSAHDGIRSLNSRVAKDLVFTVNELSWAVNVGRDGYRLASR